MTNPSTGVAQESTTSLRGVQRVGLTTLVVVTLSLILALAQLFSGSNTGVVLQDRPECPHDRDTAVWIAGKYTNIPEFHDCQRLIVKNSHALTYGGLAAVFLGENVIGGKTSVTFMFSSNVVSVRNLPNDILRPSGGVSRITTTVGPQTTPIFSAGPGDYVITVSPGGTATLQTTTAVATPWVEVASEMDYLSLGIYKGYNCMFIVEHKSGTTVVLTDAKMVKVASADDPCDKHKDEPGTALGLFPNPNPTGAAVPAVTRWVWSPSDSTQLIGVPCGTSWCDAGPHAGPGAVGAAFPQAVAGWYDQQYLADYTGGSGPVVSSAMGTVFPEPDLDRKNSAYYSKKFQVVAHVAMSTALLKYESRYAYGHVAANALPRTMATVSLCYGEREECPGVPSTAQCKVAPGQMSNLPADAAIDHPWWAKVSSPSGSPGGSKDNYFCTGYRGLPTEIKMPGVVRWRWRAKDETIWIPCAQGCCEVDADLK